MLRALNEIARFASFLNIRPNIDELLVRLATDFLSHLNPKGLTIAALIATRKFEPMHNWGEPNSVDTDKLERDLHTTNIVASLSSNGLMRNQQELEELIAPITNGKIVAGALVCACGRKANEEELEHAKTILTLTSSYLYPKMADTNHSQSDLKTNPLTARQRQVLTGFVEGKTNHEMATELGFSISTIRHETMAIFKALGVSDRKEAAKLSQQQNLI
jgi:DNA-binding CsgD family transcriptional regulator